MTVEDRVTAALHELAEGTAPPVDGELRLTARLRREHRNRRLAAIAGTVAAVVAVAGVVSLTDLSGRAAPAPAPLATEAPASVAPTPFTKPTPSDEPSPAPSYPPPAAGVGGPRWFLALEPAGKWAFHDARTGESSGHVNPTGYTVTAVAAGGNDRAYYSAATKGKCGAVLFHRVEVMNGDVHSVSNHDVPGADGLTGEVISMALSLDGTRLAYSIATKIDPEAGECSTYELRVLNLRTGSTRVWTGEDATPGDLSWAPDDRTLLVHVNPCCGDYSPGVSRLDTRASGRSFVDLPTIPGTDDISGSCVASVTASSDSEVFAARECGGGGGEQQSIRVAVIDPVSGRVLREVATVAGVASVMSFGVSSDGAHLLLAALGGGPPQDYRIDHGDVSLLPTHLAQIAW